MSRVLQIRRGTTAQNDNFTGLAGEISFDTDIKTLRVHDGETLGGFALARADAIPDIPDAGDGFDINSVPDEFWAVKFSQFGGGASFNIATSPIIELYGTTLFECVFEEINKPAIFADVCLICKNPSAGYSVDEKVHAFGLGAHGAPGINTFVKYDGLHAVFMCGEQKYWVYHRATGVPTDIEYDDWYIQFRVCY